MPYFKDLDTLEIVFRQHQINAEVIDGLIEPVGEEMCYIVAHVPNKKMGWDLKPIDKLPAEDAFEKVSELGKVNVKGRPFYRAVVKKDLKDYVSLNESYGLKSDSLVEPQKQIKSRPLITNDPVPKVEDRKPVTSGRKVYKPILQRDKAGEKPLRRRS